MKLDVSIGDTLFKLEKERGLDIKDVRIALEQAMLSAYKKKFGTKENIKVEITPNWKEINFLTIKKVVSKVNDPNTEISLKKAAKLYPDAKIDDQIYVPLDISIEDFGHFAIKVAKQVIVQKLREAERKNLYEQYKDKVGEIITGVVNRIEKGNLIVKLGKYEAVLNKSEQIPGELYRVGDTVKIYLVDVRISEKGTCQIILSRTHEGFVIKLFEREVPEITDKIVTIKSIAREAGSRTKIAVYSSRPNIDPIGTCIGSKGSRIQAIINELYKEKIDIVKWSPNIEEYVINALSPAKVISVKVLDEQEKKLQVIVPDNQLSLAIGKDGQNVRLASRLVGYHLDILSETQYKERGKQ